MELSDNKKMKRKHLVEATEEAGKRKRKKKEKKWVFDLPGQKRPTPSEVCCCYRILNCEVVSLHVN